MVCLLSLLLSTAWAKKPGTLRPVLGWNTWCTENECGEDWCSSKEVLSVGLSMKENGLLAAGYEYLNLDDCWGVRNPETSHIEADLRRFPEGMKHFVDNVHALGFKVGVYTDMGSKGCHHPFTGSWPFYEQDAQDFAAWGIDYVKFDYCSPPEGYTPAALTSNFSSRLEASGRDIWLNFHCNWLTFEDERCAEYGNSFRIAPDHVDRWYSTLKTSFALMDRRSWWGQSAARSKGFPDPDFVFTGGEGCGQRSPPGQRCPGQTDEEYRSEWSVNAIASGQLLFASDPRNMSALQRSIWLNQEVLGVFQDASGLDKVRMVSNYSKKPPENTCNAELMDQLSHGTKCIRNVNFGCVQGDGFKIWASGGCRGMFKWFGTPDVNCESGGEGFPKHNNVTCSCSPHVPQVWVRPLSPPGQIAVLLFNAGNEDSDITFQFNGAPGWKDTTIASARDLWLKKDLGRFVANYTAKGVRPHSSVFLKLSIKHAV